MAKTLKDMAKGKPKMLKLSHRIAILWMATTGADHPRGSMAWFARMANVRPRTVRNWCNGHHDPERSPEGTAALTTLKRMEKKTNRGFMADAVVRYEHFRSSGPERYGKGE